eukprot:SAG11_NODE_282_length_11247_cov_11.050323_7_plen_87_part_00
MLRIPVPRACRCRDADSSLFPSDRVEVPHAYLRTSNPSGMNNLFYFMYNSPTQPNAMYTYIILALIVLCWELFRSHSAFIDVLSWF